MWSKLSSALKPREGNDSDPDNFDPFRANATTYYTNQTPPTSPSGVHSRTASREENIIWSLRTQLALQQQMCSQFEIDLSARDELVKALTLRLDASEKENDKRKNVVRSWKKKAVDLEKMCRHLEEEAENSRQETMERSIMDEASGEALRQLHGRISQLEREKIEIEEAREKADMEATLLRKELDTSNKAHAEALHQISLLERRKGEVEAERDNHLLEITRLRAHVQQLKKDSAVMEVTILQLNKQLDQDKEDIDGLNIALESKQQELKLVKRKHGVLGMAGPTSGRAGVAPTVGKPVGSTKVSRTSAASTRSSSPIPRAPSALGVLSTNTRPSVTNIVRRPSSSSAEFKTKLPNRRVSATSTQSETDEKENSIPVPSKNSITVVHA